MLNPTRVHTPLRTAVALAVLCGNLSCSPPRCPGAGVARLRGGGDEMFRIGPTKDTGLGLFATRDIAIDTPILDEAVSFRLPRAAMDDDAALSAALAQLSSADREAFGSLCGRDDRARLATNCATLVPAGDTLGVRPREEVGIFLQSARLNHACRPSAVRAIEGGAMSVVAQRHIRAGEQITISYLGDNFQPAAARLAELRAKGVLTAGEGCLCDLCTAPPDVLAASDARRRDLRRMRQEFVRQPDAGAYKSMLALMEEEKLYAALMGEAAMIAMIELFSGKSAGSLSAEDVHGRLDVGAKVRLHKLEKRPELNGRLATVVERYDAATGRMGVALDGEAGGVMAIKAENLCYVRPGSVDEG